jgi:DNA repair protein RecN (Recombination protein N)
MLSLLKIRNLALVDELLWELGSGLISVTGETGAGKSVIVGALKLVLGERADKSLIRSGTDSCSIEAIFDLASHASIDPILEGGGLPLCGDEPLIIRRIITHTGSRQFINDSPVTLSLLKKLGSELVDLHGPHDHQSLLSQERQLSMLDAYGGACHCLTQYRTHYRVWRDLCAQLEEWQHAERASDHELELLRHLVQEIDAANLQPTDEHELQDRWRRSANSTRLAEGTAGAMHRLTGDDGILARIADLQRTVRELERLDPALDAWSSSLAECMVGMEDLESSMRDYVEDLDTDPQDASRLEERLNVVESLKRKYGSTLAEVLSRRNTAAARLDALENRESHIHDLRKHLSQARADLDTSAKELTVLRKKSAPRLAKEIAGQLKDLGFRQSCFEISLHRLAEPGPHGAESAEFIFGPNPGEPMQPLRQIASSGEISRVMLAVKSALADQDDTPLMVFDEIDANVGGEIATAVGCKMASLGQRHQVVAITHFPQVAAKATHHFVVTKEVVGGRTHSRLTPVSGTRRIDELVRMLGGGGEKVRSMAATLLDDHTFSNKHGHY